MQTAFCYNLIMPKTITVATWNISGGRLSRSTGLFDYEADESLEYLASELANIQPDIVCIPETHLSLHGSAEKSLTARLAEKLGLPYSHEVGLHPSHIDGRYVLGLGLMSARPFSARNIPLPQPNFPLRFKDGKKSIDHTRWLVVADFPGLTVSTTHNWPLGIFQHSYSTEPGATYGRALEQEYLKALPANKPLILAGDLNFDLPDEVMPELIEQLALKEAINRQQPTRNSGDRPDHILYSPGLKCLEARAIPGKSEHYLCYAKFQA